MTRPAPTFASFFALDMAFGRRLAFSCLLTLAVLGSYLVTRETGEPAMQSPEMIMAQQDAPYFDSAQAHEAMLATLTRAPSVFSPRRDLLRRNRNLGSSAGLSVPDSHGSFGFSSI